MKSFLIIPILICLSLFACSNENDSKIAALEKKVEQLTKRNEQATLKGLYELQEKCGKNAEEYFKENFKESSRRDKDGNIWTTNFTCHYNKKFNKCFILITNTCYPQNIAKNNLGIFTTKNLINILENKDYGQFNKAQKSSFMICEIDGKKCNSEDEWDTLVKPYMEE